MKTVRLSNSGWGSSIQTLFDHTARHGKDVIRHLTLARLVNAIWLAIELLLRRRIVRSRPLVVKIEPANICNFRCPGCRTGSGDDTSERGQITFDNFTCIVDQTYKWAFKCILYMWGEPLIHSRLFDMIEYATRKNLAVQISSNMNVFRDGYAERLVESGLAHLIVAMDGTTQDVYETYRVGGRLHKVIENTKAVVKAKKQRGSKTPFVELQFIVFPHNKHQIDEAESLAAEIGVDRFTILNNPSNVQTTSEAKSRPADKCSSLWMMACFNWDGSFSPCCDSVDESFGNALQNDFPKLWNSEKMQKSRSLHSSCPMDDGPPTKCTRCRIYGSYVTFLNADQPATADVSEPAVRLPVIHK